MGARILHIIDGSNFIDYVKATYEINNYENYYSTYSDIDLFNLRESFDLIIIHFLRREYAPLLSGKYFEVDKIIWTIWGADAFQLGRYFNLHLMPQTKKHRFLNEFSKGFYKGLLNCVRIISPTLFDYQTMFQRQISCIKKIKNVITLAPGDDIELKKHYGLVANSYHLNYLDPIFINLLPTKFNEGNNILLGNSAEYTNNHYEAIDILSTLELANRKVIIPVSYGDKTNSKAVEKYAKEKLGNKAEVLTGFMPFGDYVELLNTCEISVMPHIRQQALGNIVKLIFNGSHLYLNKKSNIYKFLISKEFKVSTLEDLNGLKTLTLENKETNRLLVEKFFGKEYIHQKTSKIISEVLNN
ncbi:TDP-N-acetylfucosamine:lipid II N-acetylfucosaminyltransferase [Lacihabitans soyangensis]|uniref:4-alpha-L-fucosyltransferase n=1 Tax=Lacihabitans soyangensis TaxID=869394 RepID=A0AAE3KUV2_9BACT|nr:TDP-N-acetylfucosamine:lipid II N-acetylfucosaminyltransferase [Lacihabitans soyangensis]MCP9765339.1 hypothetical protein [Lacihabitans soyangensis]